MHETRLFWWTWVIIGFSGGAYLHCAILRHWINQALITILQKTDRYHKELKPTKVKATKAGIDEDTLRDILNNPDIKIKGVTK